MGRELTEAPVRPPPGAVVGDGRLYLPKSVLRRTVGTYQGATSTHERLGQALACPHECLAVTLLVLAANA